MSSLKERAANCVTHHHACDCREYKQQARIDELVEAAERVVFESLADDAYAPSVESIEELRRAALLEDKG